MPDYEIGFAYYWRDVEARRLCTPAWLTPRWPYRLYADVNGQASLRVQVAPSTSMLVRQDMPA